MKIESRTDLVLSVVALVVFSAMFFYPYYSGSNASSANQETTPSDVMRDVSGMARKHNHEAMMAKGVIVTPQDPEQDPDQPGQTPTHRLSPGDGCSSVNPNAPNKKRNGVKANTVGCKCVRKCQNGYTVEDLSRDKDGVLVCRNACFRDRCFCPDPCKS